MKPKILIADDSAINRMILTDILGDQYEYLYAEDGLQALEMLEQNSSLDLLLLDIFMPKLNGFGVLEVMQHWAWAEELPVIIISSEDNADFIQRAYDLGATDYIRRPFNLTVVQRRVSNTLKLYSRQRRLVRMVERQVLEREQTNTTIVNILSHVIESRNNEPGGHLLHVRTLTELLLRKLAEKTDAYSLSEQDISRITTLSALHDIGKLSIPLRVLNKPGKLTAEEWEIMKSHSEIGDRLLRDVPIDQNDPMIRTAREIARWHHERWDGRGYPDGLLGDAIPISAQVVSVADVYDALTSDRVYKKAFDHETALNMILEGQCGAFNPLLLECLLEVGPQMYAAKQSPGELFDFHSEAKRLAAELMTQQSLPGNDRTYRMLSMWQEKTAFFEQQCRGIQFEYDRWMGKVTLIDWNEPEESRRKTLYLQEDDSIPLLKPEDWLRLQQLILETSWDSPEVETRMLVPVGGVWRWHRICIRTIWPSKDKSFAGAVGQFTDIHQQVVTEAMSVLEAQESNSRELMRIFGQMRKIFDLVRLVEPTSKQVMTFQEDGRLITTKECCYNIWCRDGSCSNCSSLRALDESGWISKLEMMGSSLYCVLSRAQSIAGRRCVLEIAMRTDDQAFVSCDDATPGTAGSYLMNFYKDSVTHAYSRLYLDSFLPNLEHSDAVCFLDLDHFKVINDRFGHQVGDRSIEAISRTVLHRITPEDKLIRYGGDEFVLIFKAISEEGFLTKMADIQTAIRDIQIPDYPEVKLDISYGCSYQVYPLGEAIRQADFKMYQMKSAKKRLKKEDTP